MCVMMMSYCLSQTMSKLFVICSQIHPNRYSLTAPGTETDFLSETDLHRARTGLSLCSYLLCAWPP